MENVPHPEEQRDISGLPVRKPHGHILTPDTHTIPPMHLPNLKPVPPGEESHIQSPEPPSKNPFVVTPEDTL